jgi:hypothetical protein
LKGCYQVRNGAIQKLVRYTEHPRGVCLMIEIDRLLGFTTLHDSRRYAISIYLSICLMGEI